MVASRRAGGKDKGKAPVGHISSADVDSVADGAAAAVSNEGEIAEFKFKHLLEPIRDLALNWNIDIAQVGFTYSM